MPARSTTVGVPAAVGGAADRVVDSATSSVERSAAAGVEDEVHPAVDSATSSAGHSVVAAAGAAADWAADSAVRSVAHWGAPSVAVGPVDDAAVVAARPPVDSASSSWGSCWSWRSGSAAAAAAST